MLSDILSREQSFGGLVGGVETDSALLPYISFPWSLILVAFGVLFSIVLLKECSSCFARY